MGWGSPRWRRGVTGTPGTFGNQNACHSHGPGSPPSVLKAAAVAAPTLSEARSQNPESGSFRSPVAPEAVKFHPRPGWLASAEAASLPRTVARRTEKLGSLRALFVPCASSCLGAAREATAVLGPQPLGLLFTLAGVNLLVPSGPWW